MHGGSFWESASERYHRKLDWEDMNFNKNLKKGFTWSLGKLWNYNSQKAKSFILSCRFSGDELLLVRSCDLREALHCPIAVNCPYFQQLEEWIQQFPGRGNFQRSGKITEVSTIHLLFPCGLIRIPSIHCPWFSSLRCGFWASELFLPGDTCGTCHLRKNNGSTVAWREEEG